MYPYVGFHTEVTMQKVDTEGPVRVEQVPVERLQPAARNPRTHSKGQLDKLMHSIRTFGFVNPILADDGGRIIAGHGRWEAAKRMGLPAVPVVRISHLSAAQRRAYLVADNRLAELAGWDRELLKLELGELLIEATRTRPHRDRVRGGRDRPAAARRGILRGDRGSGGGCRT
jgi:ParB-like chromosome segregation protein Spo0J